MKKLTLTLSLLTVLLYSCNGALDPTEEHIIRGKGIEDRIFVTSKETPKEKLQCTVSIKDKMLTLTLSEEQNFTVSLYNDDEQTLIFAQMYAGAAGCTIDLTDFPDGDYTLYINEEGVYQFSLSDGMGDQTNKTSADIIPWEEIIKNASSVPRDVFTVTINNFADAITKIALTGYYCTLNIMGETSFSFEEYGDRMPEIADMGRTIGITSMTEIPKGGWGAKADILPLHGYFVRCRLLQKDGVTYSDYRYLRLFVLEFNVSDDGIMNGVLQFQTLKQLPTY